MANTVLTACPVPWMVAPSMGAVTLRHTETDVEPECAVVFGGGRMTAEGVMDLRRIELVFKFCYHARTGPISGGGIASIYPVEPSYEGDMSKYLKWLEREWNASGLCPKPGFYVATESAWLSGSPEVDRDGARHYVIAGRDGYVELVASGYRWQEWMWEAGRREDTPALGAAVHTGTGD